VNNALARAGTKTYDRWHKAVLEYYRGETPKHGAIWVTIYPNIMLEWYAHVLIVSTLIPRGVDRTTNVVEFYYPEEIALFEREFVEAEQAAYLETAAEDDEIAERMDAGRRALCKLGRNETGPYQSPMEDGMQHFHEFLRASSNRACSSGIRAARRGALPAAMTYSTLISTEALAAHLDDPAFVVVDCRHDLADPSAGERAYRAGHVPGARFMHLDRDLSGARTGRNGRHPLPAVDALAGVFGRAGIDAARQVVAYDQSTGAWASRLWWLLRWLGHDAVAVLDGGLDRWRAQGRAVTAETRPPHPARFVPKPPAATASAEEILGHLNDGALLVIDARGAERYRGDVEPVDPVAGHIPGARNRPYSENLARDGRFKPPEALGSEFRALLGETPASAVVHQCGSGVSACHNALAMAIAGLSGSRLYPGSWSEWVADPARPVARGG
jgi:thiosulfate/3-mercaptopyruvate sulfurtransferase